MGANDFKGAEAGKALGDAIATNTVLKELDIHASTVLAVYDDTIVPHNSVIEGDLKLELVIVSSGG